MFISYWIWLLRTRRLRERAEEAGLDFDIFPEAVEWQNNSYKLGCMYANFGRDSHQEAHPSNVEDTEPRGTGIPSRKDTMTTLEIQRAQRDV